MITVNVISFSKPSPLNQTAFPSDLLNDFGGWKMKIILVKRIEFGDNTIKSVGEFKIKLGFSKIVFFFYFSIW